MDVGQNGVKRHKLGNLQVVFEDRRLCEAWYKAIVKETGGRTMLLMDAPNRWLLSKLSSLKDMSPSLEGPVPMLPHRIARIWPEDAPLDLAAARSIGKPGFLDTFNKALQAYLGLPSQSEEWVAVPPDVRKE